jgi:hypothetical protein
MIRPADCLSNGDQNKRFNRAERAAEVSPVAAAQSCAV